jgi:aquaporin Z
MDREDSRRLAAEVFGTFALVFAGTGAIVINDISDHAITHVGIALTFGWIVLAMIYAIGDISGCHLNPAVTLGFVVAGRMEKRLVIPYIVSQSAGAILASTVLKMLFLEHSTLGATLPRGSDWQSFILEILLTMILMVVILCVSSGSKEKGVLAGVAVGSVIALEAMFAGPISGASMNPARSLAPALLSGHMASLWVYLVAPVIGATLAIPIFRVLYMSEQRGVGP